MIDHRSYAHTLRSSEIKAWENSDLNGIRTHDHIWTAEDGMIDDMIDHRSYAQNL